MRDGTGAGMFGKWAVVATQAAALMTAGGCGDSTQLSVHESAGGGANGTGGGGGAIGTGGVGGSSGAGGHVSPPAPPTGCQTPAGAPGVWEEIAAPPEQAGFRASDAFAVGADDLLFAGATFDPASIDPASNPRVLRWSHGCWTVEVTIPASGTQQERVSVHGTGPNDLWATAEDQLFHRDAQGWSRFPDESWRGQLRLPLPFSDELVISRVRAATPGDVWVAATTHLLHWTGQSWSVFNFNDASFPNSSAAVGYFYNDIWIDAPNDVWFGGPADQIGNTMDGSFVHHFDGSGFTHQLIGLGSLYALRRGGGVLWLANPTQDFIGGQTVSRTLRRLDATSAPSVPIAGVDETHPEDMVVLWGRGGAEMWASGTDLAHFDGQSWSLVADAPAAARGGITLNDTLVTGDAGAVWIATPGPRFFRKVDGP